VKPNAALQDMPPYILSAIAPSDEGVFTVPVWGVKREMRKVEGKRKI